MSMVGSKCKQCGGSSSSCEHGGHLNILNSPLGVPPFSQETRAVGENPTALGEQYRATGAAHVCRAGFRPLALNEDKGRRSVVKRVPCTAHLE